MSKATGLDKAKKLADGALSGFRAAHTALTQANEILDAEQAVSRSVIAEHTSHIDRCQSAAADNASVIAKLADLIGV